MWTLVWALKSFLYSFGKVIIGGVKREMQVRSQEGATNFDKIGGVAMMGGLMAAAFLPLAMVGLELREIAKAGIVGRIAGSRRKRSLLPIRPNGLWRVPRRDV